MNFAVRWREPASTQLLVQLLRAVDKQAILAVARAVERRLERNPAEEGEGREEPYRLLFVRPFCVLFQIDEPSKTVYIDELKWVGP